MSDHGHGDHGHAAHAHGDDHGHAEHGHGSTGLYLSVTGALMVLTLGSFLTYWPTFRETVPLQARWLFMMAIAVTKASLVMLFFMHLKWEANWKWILTVPASLMSLLLVLALVPDVGLRFMDTWHSGPSRQRLTFAADRANGEDDVMSREDREREADHGEHAGH